VFLKTDSKLQMRVILFTYLKVMLNEYMPGGPGIPMKEVTEGWKERKKSDLSLWRGLGKLFNQTGQIIHMMQRDMIH
jgi:accessory colonization factor AcfC